MSSRNSLQGRNSLQEAGAGQTHLSYSQLKTYSTCPRQYKYKYIDNLASLPTQQMTEGTQRHLDIYKIIQENKIETIKDEKLKALLEKVASSGKTFIEEEFSIQTINALYVGFIDLYSVDESTIYIVDFKSYAVPEDDLQLKIYAYALSQKYPDAEFFIAWFYMLGLGFYKRYFYTKDDLSEVETLLSKKADEIYSDKEFPKKPSPACATCPFVKECFDAKDLSRIVSIGSLEQAKDIADKVVVAEAFLKQIKDKIKEFLISNGEEELVTDAGNRVYLSPMVTLRFGKVRGKKNVKDSSK